MSTSKWMQVYLKLATKNKMSFPFGRAFYMLGRHWNGCLSRYGLSSAGISYFPQSKFVGKSLRYRRIAALKSIREETAKRWESHYFSDGSPKGIRYTNRDWNFVKSTLRYDSKKHWSHK
jgi:hypothetical protein